MPDAFLAPILTDGLRRIHYFNGRVLTAEDLAVEQTTLRERDRRLGRALGTGVVEGLEVAAAATPRPSVTIAAGLALNPEGEALVLAKPVTIEVAPEDDPTVSGDALFMTCPGASAGSATPVGTGAYVLVVGPATG
ncbi:MAG TPA: hypothetical protein VK610_10280, partial [Rhodothermales bacterium]|nr:hypothetical protein [Rhodothermales bacterium]